jgi:hypothetical protein
VKTKVLDPGVLESRFERLLWVVYWMAGILLTLEDILAFARFLQLKQCLSGDLIHWDVARLSAFGFGYDQPIAAEINLLPLQIQNFACPSPKPHPPLVSITWGNRI